METRALFRSDDFLCPRFAALWRFLVVHCFAPVSFQSSALCSSVLRVLFWLRLGCAVRYPGDDGRKERSKPA